MAIQPHDIHGAAEAQTATSNNVTQFENTLAVARKYIEDAEKFADLVQPEVVERYLALSLIDQMRWEDIAKEKFGKNWQQRKWNNLIKEARAAAAARAVHDNGGVKPGAKFIPNKGGLADVFIREDMQLREITDAIMGPLAEANQVNPSLFVQNEKLVSLRQSDVNALDVKIEEATEGGVENAITRSANLYEIKVKRDQETGTEFEERKAAMPQQQWTRNILNQSSYRDLPKLRGVRNAPVLLPNGRLVQQAGFDRESGYFINMPADLMTPVAEQPSRADAIAAREHIYEHIFSGFSYANEGSAANSFAYFLTPAGREYHTGLVPLGLFEAPVAGSGKSLEVKKTIATYHGYVPSSIGNDTLRDEAELRKTLLTLVKDGAQFLFADDITGLVGNGELQRFLTMEHFSGRILGVNEFVSGPNMTTPMLTSNNAILSGDMWRRVAAIRLNTGMAKPSERPSSMFKHPELDKWLMGNYTERGMRHYNEPNRGLFLHDIYTIWEAWLAAGCPQASHVRNMANYEQWCATMAALLEFVEFPGFLANQDDVVNTMWSEDREWTAFFIEFERVFGLNMPVTSNAITIALRDEYSDDIIKRFDPNAVPGAFTPRGTTLDKLTAVRVTNTLDLKRDRPVGGYVLVRREDSHTKIAVWTLRHADAALETSTHH